MQANLSRWTGFDDRRVSAFLFPHTHSLIDREDRAAFLDSLRWLVKKTSLSRWVCWFDQSSRRDCASAILRICFIVQTFISFSWGVCSNVCSAKLDELESQTANTRCIQKMTEKIIERFRHQHLKIVHYYSLLRLVGKIHRDFFRERKIISSSVQQYLTLPKLEYTQLACTYAARPTTHWERESGREKAKLHKPHMLNFMLSTNHLKVSSMCVLSHRDALMHNSWRDHSQPRCCRFRSPKQFEHLVSAN